MKRRWYRALLKGLSLLRGSGNRTIPLKLVGQYIGHVKGVDQAILFGEAPSGGRWIAQQERVLAMNLPAGVVSDVLPVPEAWVGDTLGVHHDVLALGVHPVPFSRDLKLCRTLRHSVLKPFEKGQLRLKDLILLERWKKGDPITTHRFQDAIILDEKRGHFGHWLFEQLPQLRLLEDVEGLVVLINGADAWKLDLVESFGFPRERCFQYSGEEVFEIRNLWMTNGGRLGQEDLLWLREKALSRFGIDPESPKRIFVSRRGVGSRFIANLDEIEPVLSEFDIVVVRPEELGLEQSVRMLANCELIIGPEGSGMRNMVWAEDLLVIEIFGHEVNFGQWSMATALDFCYMPYVEPRVVLESEKRGRILDNGGFCVDPSRLRHFLQRTIG